LKKPYPIQGWKFCVSFALFRMGTILQGVASRAAKGQASNPAAEIIGSFFIFFFLPFLCFFFFFLKVLFS